MLVFATVFDLNINLHIQLMIHEIRQSMTFVYIYHMNKSLYCSLYGASILTYCKWEVTELKSMEISH